MTTPLYVQTQTGLIKTLLADPSKIIEATRYVNEDDFSDLNLGLIFESIRSLQHDQIEVTLPGIIEHLLSTHPEVNIDTTWVLGLDSDVTKWVAKGSAKTWAKLLKEQSAKVKASALLSTTIKDLSQTTTKASDVLNKMAPEVERILINSIEENEETNKDRVDRYKQYMLERHNTQKNIIPSPYPSIDKYTVGWLPGQLITIGARTSIGKSVVATQSAIAACASNKSVLMFSLEMGEYEVIDRMISAMSNVELGAIRSRPLTEDEVIRHNRALETFEKFNIAIDENPDVTLDYIVNKAVKMSQSEHGLDMIIIDYLQLITHDKRGANREQIVAELSRGMKKLAKQLQVPVMILAQLNREGKDADEEALPNIKDIRESAAIAADSDIILLIHRKLVSDEIDPKALFIIGKNRNGQPGKKISVRCDLEFAKFTDDGLLKDQEPSEAEAIASQDEETEPMGEFNYGKTPFVEENGYNNSDKDFFETPFITSDDEENGIFEEGTF